ncbi:MAG: PEP/pyruvate-binding domain-containing protein [Candidatus Nanohaloarchaea archaeon]
MVQWKNQLEGDVGEKARFLDSVENLSVPNFFVITPQEVQGLFGSNENERVLNSQANEEYRRRIKEAYTDIGMSSEVRNASGKAKNLVGGQRSSQLVSVRVSGRNSGKYQYRLNVGSSDLMDAVKEVAATYYEHNDDNPAIIVQKMVEAEYSGSALIDYDTDLGLMEVVEGFGVSLEEGLTQPHIYLLTDNGVARKSKADEQLKISRNPINGQNRRQEVNPSSVPFSDNEVEEFFSDIVNEGFNVKFAYKRGSFHVIDAWKARPNRVDRREVPEIQGLRVSEGEIQGRVGRDIRFSDRTVPPEEYSSALIAKKGGYASRDAQKARKQGKPAIFSFMGELDEGQEIRVEEGSTEISNQNGSNPFTSQSSRSSQSSDDKSSYDLPGMNSGVQERSEKIDNVLAAEVMPLNPESGHGVHLQPPYGTGYAISDYETNAFDIPRSGYVSSYGDVFSFDGDVAVLDLRRLGKEGRVEAVKYLEAEKRILVMNRAEEEVISEAVEEGYDVYAAPERFLSELRSEVARQEKRFIMDRLRDL